MGIEDRRKRLVQSLYEQQLRTDDIKLTWLQEFIKLQALICSTGVAGALLLLQQTSTEQPSAVRWALILFLAGLVTSALIMFHVMNAYAAKGYEIWVRRSEELFKAKTMGELDALLSHPESQNKSIFQAGAAISIGWLMTLTAIGLMIYHFW